MAEEQTEKAEQPPVPTQEVQVAVPVPVKKPAPTDELADTIDRFLTGLQVAGIRAMNSGITKVQAKVDEIITTLDGGSPPKKQEKPSVPTPPDGTGNPPQKQG